ncbi:MAG: CehA/McbA family metallohydrolase domain-containing protein [Planctomycetota bacterium]|jgi:hypothetical protein
MQFANPFKNEGLWLKGNTHLHTTESDGRLSPQEAAVTYEKNGYDFLFYADHWKRTKFDYEGNLIAIAAEELDLLIEEKVEIHIVCWGLKEELIKSEIKSIEDLKIYAEREGIKLIIAHPFYSGLNFKHLSPLTYCSGFEVFNTFGEKYGRAVSASQWDELLESGHKIYGFAADDTHRVETAENPGGWIMVKAAEKTESSILAAIDKGMFYATQGPEIKKIELSETEIKVECSPCRRINFISRSMRGNSVIAEDNKMLTEASSSFRPDQIYIRIECIDNDGKTAWSNPVFL